MNISVRGVIFGCRSPRYRVKIACWFTLQRLLAELTSRPITASDLTDALEACGVDVRPHLSPTQGKLLGFAFGLQGRVFSASALGRCFLIKNLKKKDFHMSKSETLRTSVQRETAALHAPLRRDLQTSAEMSAALRAAIKQLPRDLRAELQPLTAEINALRQENRNLEEKLMQLQESMTLQQSMLEEVLRHQAHMCLQKRLQSWGFRAVLRSQAQKQALCFENFVHGSSQTSWASFADISMLSGVSAFLDIFIPSCSVPALGGSGSS